MLGSAPCLIKNLTAGTILCSDAQIMGVHPPSSYRIIKQNLNTIPYLNIWYKALFYTCPLCLFNALVTNYSTDLHINISVIRF